MQRKEAAKSAAKSNQIYLKEATVICYVCSRETSPSIKDICRRM